MALPNRCRPPEASDLGPLGPPPRRVHSHAMLGPGTVSARVLGHPAMLLGGPRALLLQLAHPLVAAGVAAHSDFRLAPFDRLLRTLSAMGTIAFADPHRSGRALAAVAATHSRVRGRAPDGRPYSATDPRLAAWVHATLIDTALEVECRWIGELGPGEQARFYEETLALARAFGVPAGPDRRHGRRVNRSDDRASGPWLPEDLPGFRVWFGREAERLEVSPQARAMAAEVLHPPLAGLRAPVGRLAEPPTWSAIATVTADLLPGHLRQAYDLPAPAGVNRAALELGGLLAPPLARRLPPALRRPDALVRLAAALTGGGRRVGGSAPADGPS